MKYKILPLFVLLSLSSAQAASIECKGLTISEDEGRPATIILSYDEFPTRIKKLTVVTERTRSWKINECIVVPESKCRGSEPFGPNAPDYAVAAINVSGATHSDELGLFIGREKGNWIGYFWDGSIMNPEIEIISCKVKTP